MPNVSPMFAGAALLAHQGGWDEILLVAGPIIVIIVVLAIAKRRVESQLADKDFPDSAGAEVGPSDTR